MLQEFLKSEGVDETTPKDKVESLKKAFWTARRRMLNREKRGSKKEVRFSLNSREWMSLKVMADQKSLTVTEYVKECVRVYNDGLYIPPKIEDLENLKSEIRKIGVNLNQITFRFHTLGDIANVQLVESLHSEMKRVIRNLENAIKNPSKIDDLIYEKLKDKPQQLNTIIHSMKQGLKDAHYQE